MLYAHSFKDKEKSDWQTLEQHLHAVSVLASKFASDFNAGKWASIAALLHDIGKGSKEFQKRLEGSSIKVDHASAGAQYLMQNWGKKSDGTKDTSGECYAKILAYVIAGHHSGLPDCGATSFDIGSLTARLAVKIPEYQRALNLISVPSYTTLGAPPISFDTDCAFRLSFFIRMLYSCLTDADFLDTEAFCSPKTYALRQISPDISVLYERLYSELKERAFLAHTQITTQQLYSCVNTACGSPARKNAINLARKAILQHCLDAADSSSGVFSLTVPTGGGKTISSMAFALKHAQKHSLLRVILVVPYTSIIEQNADILRDILGEDAVLEHHCNYIHPHMDNAEEAEQRYNIYVQEKAVLNERNTWAYTAYDLKPETKKLPKAIEDAKKVTGWMCKNFFDVRAFGAVMSTEINCGQVRGPVQFCFAQSIEPIVPTEVTITRMAVTNEKDIDKERTMGRKFIVPYGLYRAEGFISAPLAERTGFTEADLELLWEALINMFDQDHSAARGKMSTRKLFIFKHECKMGNASAHSLFERITCTRKDEDITKPARSFSDYDINVNKDGLTKVSLEER